MFRGYKRKARLLVLSNGDASFGVIKGRHDFDVTIMSCQKRKVLNKLLIHRVFIYKICATE